MRDIRHVRQAVADNNAAQAKLKAEGRTLMGVASEKRTREQAVRLEAIDTELGGLTHQAVTLTEELAHFERLADEERRQASPSTTSTLVRPTGRTYAAMFPHVQLDAGGFRSSDEFLATIHSGLNDPRLVQSYSAGQLGATSTIGVPSDGGFSVPTEFFRQWLDSSLENEIVRSRADIRPMISSDAVAPGWDDSDHSDVLYGGFSGQWVPEAGTITEQQPMLRLIHLHARKLAILTRTSNELIADGVSFEAQLGQAIMKALGYFLDRAFLFGNGAGSPLGVINSPATITVAKETNQVAATINYTNIAKMFARLHPSAFADSVWVCNSTAIPQLLQLSMAVGTGGSHIPVLSESGGKFTMLTRPVVFTEKVPALGSVGDIGLYSFSSYIVGMRADFQLAKSAHVGFASDTSYYRGIIRVDGQPKLMTPITPEHGDTLSPFVVLAERA